MKIWSGVDYRKISVAPRNKVDLIVGDRYAAEKEKTGSNRQEMRKLAALFISFPNKKAMKRRKMSTQNEDSSRIYLSHFTVKFKKEA